MRKLRAAITLAASLAASAALADQTQTFLACKITQAVDDKGTVTKTTGTDVFGIAPQPDGSTTYTLPAGCAKDTITAKVTNMEMSFECDAAADPSFEYMMTINRVSGEYTKTFAKKGGGGLVHSGHCTPSKQRF